MPVPNSPTVASVTLVGTQASEERINRFHVSTDDEITHMTAADLTALADIFESWYLSYYSNYISNTVGLDQIQVRKYSPTDPLAFDKSEPHALGTQAAQALPGNVTASISLRTGFAGRKFRGRFYAWGLVSNLVVSVDQLASVYTAGMAVAGANLLTALANAGYELVVFHMGDATFTKVITVVVDGSTDSQRRRLRGRGR